MNPEILKSQLLLMVPAGQTPGVMARGITWVWTASCYTHPVAVWRKKYVGTISQWNESRSIWQGARRWWSEAAADAGYFRFCEERPHPKTVTVTTYRAGRYLGLTRHDVLIPRYRIDDYIKRGLIDPAYRDDL